MFAKIRKKSTFLALNRVFRPLNLISDQKWPLFWNPHHLLDLKIDFPKNNFFELFFFRCKIFSGKSIFWDSFLRGSRCARCFGPKKSARGRKTALKLEKVVFLCTYANYRRNWARRLKFGLVLEDDSNLVVLEDEVERAKTQCFIYRFSEKIRKSWFFKP